MSEYQGPPPRPNRRGGLAVGQPKNLPKGVEWVWRLGSYTPIAALRCTTCGDVFHTKLPIYRNDCPACDQKGVHYGGKRFNSLKDLPLEVILNHPVTLPHGNVWFAAHPDLTAQLARLEGILPVSLEDPSHELSMLVAMYRADSPEFLAWHATYEELNHVSSQVPRPNLASDPLV